MPGPLYRDPWGAREAWRKSPIFSNRAMFRNILPGFGTAVIAFSAYVIYDELIAKKSAHGHGAAHGSGHGEGSAAH
ncbi:NADH-ubiquinone oxidoreductase B12 subunit family-domain-containing protein [Dioszegia hungarica]|uniref:NADH-ubiquinone oxidoreductase B12 subunit family-domain-containing protein n=1 Tax=Dioszegia hungarica TaxID=4972 RepID=A0AA38LR74_9TREE|nr:NADH-ubiquinone oxidoreductase B12 subunit family-domain-containing protein [Dioszegia hungarica]KAI9634092.1 NADH-ubiquinone oxidoreductase B12 subunit family-domain-containing protein [Dioszegia hungarica]